MSAVASAGGKCGSFPGVSLVSSSAVMASGVHSGGAAVGEVDMVEATLGWSTAVSGSTVAGCGARGYKGNYSMRSRTATYKDTLHTRQRLRIFECGEVDHQ